MPLYRKVHVTNAKGRNATVIFKGLKPPPGPERGLPGKSVSFRRYLGAHAEGLLDALSEKYGVDNELAEALIAGDPEIDLERVGQRVRGASTVWLSSAGEVMHAPPRYVEIVEDASGAETERREPVEREQNVNDELPVRWTGREIPVREAVRRFVFGRTLQLIHQDGLTYDYLFEMATQLAEKGVMVMMGAGLKGKDPLVLQANGSPYRAFLEGRVDGDRYLLLLHLSNQELKLPAPASPEETDDSGDSKPAKEAR